MGEFVGASPRDLRDLARHFRTAAERLNAERDRVRTGLRRTAWDGRAANAFRAQWDAVHHRRIGAMAEEFRDAANVLVRNAEEQERASSAGGRNRGRFAAWGGRGALLLGVTNPLTRLALFRPNWKDAQGRASRALSSARRRIGTAVTSARRWTGRQVERGRRLVVAAGRLIARGARNAYDGFVNFGRDLRRIWDYLIVPPIVNGLVLLVGLVLQNPAISSRLNDISRIVDRARVPKLGAGEGRSCASRTPASDMAIIATLHKDNEPQARVIKVSDGPPPTYRILLAGIEGLFNIEAAGNDALGAGSSLAEKSAYVRALQAQIDLLVPEGANVMLVGHSNGGLSAMSLAADPAFEARYNVTHVLAVGAPISTKVAINPAAQVMEINNLYDGVPATDGRASTEDPPSRVVHYFLGDGPDAHGITSNYLGEVQRMDNSTDPRMTNFFDSAEAYYDKTGSDEAWDIRAVAA